MINKVTLFRADLFHKKEVGTVEQRQTLVEQIKKKQQEYPHGSDDSNPGCWRWSNPCENIDWVFDEINALLSEAIDHYSLEDKTFKNYKDCKELSVSYWANVNQPGSRNIFHSHKEDHFAVVYYLQATGTGDLRMVNYSNILGDCNKTAPFSRDVIVSPKNGDLFLWPAWIPHEVETNQSKIERINLVFNIKLK